MSGETLYAIAYEMLQFTNIFEKSIEEIKYTTNHAVREEAKLVDLVRKCTKKYNHRFRGKSEENLMRAYNSIVCAMIEYLEDLPVTFSFKQETKRNFKKWLEKIRKIYCIPEQQLPDELNPNKELDTGIALLKLMHSREGITYQEIHEELDIGMRAIQKDLVKLSPDLYSGDGEAYAPFRLGGQKLRAKIELVKPTEKANEKRFFTRNTIHPLVLQENVMQLATMLKALAYQYYDREDDVARLIAVDIWAQMSGYARKKILSYFAYSDQTLNDFMAEIDNPMPDDHACEYKTEHDMLSEIEMPVAQALEYLSKARGRTGTLVFTDGDECRLKQILEIHNENGDITYKALDSSNSIVEFSREKIREIFISKN